MSRPDTGTNFNQQINTPRLPWRRGLTNNSTDPDYLSGVIIPKTTAPASIDDATTPTSNTGVVDCKHNFTQFAFFGRDTANDNITFKIWAWSQISGATPLWIPTHVVTGYFTLSTKIGVANSPVGASDFFADGLTLTAGYNETLVPAYQSPADDSGTASTGFSSYAWLLVDTMGFDKLQVEFDINANATAGTQGNFIYRQF